MSEASEKANRDYQIRMGMTVEDAPSMDDHRNVALAFQAGWDAHAAQVVPQPNRDDIARAIALVDSLIDPPLSGKYGRYADAVIAHLSAQPVGGESRARSRDLWAAMGLGPDEFDEFYDRCGPDTWAALLADVRHRLESTVAGEVEWAVRQAHDGRIIVVDEDGEPFDEDDARGLIEDLPYRAVLMSRTVGPWIEVQP